MSRPRSRPVSQGRTVTRPSSKNHKAKAKTFGIKAKAEDKLFFPASPTVMSAYKMMAHKVMGLSPNVAVL